VHTCSVCGEDKEVEAFGFRNLAAGQRHRACKTCVAAYGRQHYGANRLEYISRNNKRSRALTYTLREQVWQYIAGRACVDCSEADPVVLDFDHVDPTEKRQTIYRLVHQAYSWNAILAEIEKCEIRCANCHRRRTAVAVRMAEAGVRIRQLARSAVTGLAPHKAGWAASNAGRRYRAVNPSEDRRWPANLHLVRALQTH
jgi:hypothetical protein